MNGFGSQPHYTIQNLCTSCKRNGIFVPFTARILGFTHTFFSEEPSRRNIRSGYSTMMEFTMLKKLTIAICGKIVSFLKAFVNIFISITRYWFESLQTVLRNIRSSG